MINFYLIRHGEPDWGFKDERNLKGPLRDFVPLTDRGIIQAEQLVELYDFSRCDLILSSPYTRSLQTAAVINQSLGLPLRVEFDLHEWTPDNWTAETAEEITLLWKDYMDNKGVCPPGEIRLWETKESVLNRTLNVLQKYKSYSNVIVICHGMIIATLLDQVSEDIGYCSVIEYRMSVRGET